MKSSVWRGAVAWGVTLGLLGFLFWRTPVAEVARAARDAEPWMVPVTLLFLALTYLADSFATWKTFGWFVARLPFLDLLLVRGAAYLLAAVNYAVGQGALVYFVSRASGAPMLRVVAAVLLMLGTNLLVLLVFATVGLLIAPEVPRALPLVLGAAYTGLAGYAILVALKPRWLAARPIFDVLLGAGARGHLKTMAVRVPHVILLFAFSYFALLAFGVVVPVGQAVAALPVVYFISALPISVQGLGTTQAAMILFFARYAPGDTAAREATVLSASLISQVIALGFQSLLGALCLKSSVGKDLRGAAIREPPG